MKSRTDAVSVFKNCFISRLGYLKDSNAAAHSVDNVISWAVIHLLARKLKELKMTIHFPPFLAVQSSRVSFLLDLKRLPFSSKCLLFLISIQSKLLLMTTKNEKIESGHLSEVVTY